MTRGLPLTDNEIEMLLRLQSEGLRVAAISRALDAAFPPRRHFENQVRRFLASRGMAPNTPAPIPRDVVPRAETPDEIMARLMGRRRYSDNASAARRAAQAQPRFMAPAFAINHSTGGTVGEIA